MAVLLLNEERIIKQANFMADAFLMTNKRLIYKNQNNPNLDTYVGLNQLQGIQSKTTPYTYEKLTDVQKKRWSFIAFVLSGIVFLVYTFSGIYIADTVGGIGAVSIMVFFYIVSFGVAISIITYILLSIYNSFTRKTVDKAQLIIMKTDNNAFANQLYDIEYLTDIQRFETEVNEIIFSKNI